jgi:hypothetical protein
MSDRDGCIGLRPYDRECQRVIVPECKFRDEVSVVCVMNV